MTKQTAYFLSVERRLHSFDDWKEMLRFPENTSVDYALIQMGRLVPIVPTAEHRLVETRVTTTKEVLT
jgi:hypothetical protein